jgi:uncharacterized protein
VARVVHFEIHADQPERAIQFYSKVFGWQFTAWGGPMPYWLIKTGEQGQPGIDGGLVTRRGPGPSDGQAVNAYVCTVDVTSVDDYVARISANGGLIALAKMAVPGVGWLAYGKDTEGNIFGIMQRDPTAK